MSHVVLTTNTTESIFKHHEKNYVTGEEAVVNFTFTVKQYKLSDHACFWLLIKNHIIWYHWVGFRISLTLERRCNFRDEIENLFFLLSPGETRSRLSYDHSRILRRERDLILLLSCFETRSRLQKIISRGRARKNEADSRREFPGSRILADLCLRSS